MMKYTLHLIFSLEAWHQASPFITDNDKVILLQDACYLSQSISLQEFNVFAREKDMQARNLEPRPHIKTINDESWVLLTEQSQNTMSWK